MDTITGGDAGKQIPLGAYRIMAELRSWHLAGGLRLLVPPGPRSQMPPDRGNNPRLRPAIMSIRYPGGYF